MKCQRNRDCLVGDYCNGGLLISGICKISYNDNTCVYDHPLNIHIKKEEKEDIPSLGKMGLTSFQSDDFITDKVVNPPESKLAKRTSVHILKKKFSLLNSMLNIHRLMKLFDKKSNSIYL